MLARLLLLSLLLMGCAEQETAAPSQPGPAAEEAWRLIGSDAFGDGGTLMIQLRSPQGDTVAFDLRTPFSDPQRRVHVHLERFDSRKMPESKPLERSSPEEQAYGRYLAEALAPHLLPEPTKARDRRFALSDAFLQSVYRWDEAKDADEPADIIAELKTELEDARAAMNAEPVTDMDWSVRIARDVLHVIEARVQNPDFGVQFEPTYNIGEFEE